MVGMNAKMMADIVNCIGELMEMFKDLYDINYPNFDAYLIVRQHAKLITKDGR